MIKQELSLNTDIEMIVHDHVYVLYFYFDNYHFSFVLDYSHSRPLSRADFATSGRSPGTLLYYFLRFISYLLLKAKQSVIQLVQLVWRFMELNVHKITMLVLFVVVLSEVSAGYAILLIISVLALPLQRFSHVLYPLLTIYIGLLSVLKTIYQFPIINAEMFNLTNYNDSGAESNCYEPLVSYICMYRHEQQCVILFARVCMYWYICS